MSLRSNDKSVYTPYEFEEIPKNEDKEISIQISDILSDVDDLAGYPIHFRSMRFAFTSDNPVGPNKIQIKEMMMVYDYMTVGFDRQEKAERFSESGQRGGVLKYTDGSAVECKFKNLYDFREAGCLQELWNMRWKKSCFADKRAG